MSSDTESKITQTEEDLIEKFVKGATTQIQEDMTGRIKLTAKEKTTLPIAVEKVKNVLSQYLNETKSEIPLLRQSSHTKRFAFNDTYEIFPSTENDDVQPFVTQILESVLHKTSTFPEVVEIILQLKAELNKVNNELNKVNNELNNELNKVNNELNKVNNELNKVNNELNKVNNDFVKCKSIITACHDGCFPKFQKEFLRKEGGRRRRHIKKTNKRKKKKRKYKKLKRTKKNR